MKPEDIIDGLGQVSDRMVLDAQNLGKRPNRGLKWASLAACFLCGVLLLGVSAAKLWHREGQESLSPSPTPAVSAPAAEVPSPDSSREEADAQSSAFYAEPQNAVMDYQVIETEDYTYFVDPYMGLVCRDHGSGEVKAILPNGECSLARSDGEVWCLSIPDRKLYWVHEGSADYMGTLEDVGPGWPTLLGVTNTTAYWMQDWTYYAQSLDSDTSTVLISQDDSGGELASCTVYQGYFYCVRTLKGSLIRVSLSTGETETIWSPEEGEPADFEQVLRLTSTTDVSVIPDRNLQNLYLEAVQTIDDVRHYVYYCMDMSTGELRELTTLEDGSVTISSWDGKLYLIHTTGLIVDGEKTTLISCDPATGETQVLLTAEQTAGFGACTDWTVGPDGLYYTRYDDQSGLYCYDFDTGESALVYQSRGVYGNLTMQLPDYYGTDGSIIENGNRTSYAYDITVREDGVYVVNPSVGVYRVQPDNGTAELVVAGTACRILDTDEGLYVTDSAQGAVCEIQNGQAQLLLTLEKPASAAVRPIGVENGKLYWNWYCTDLVTGETTEETMLRLKEGRAQLLRGGTFYCLGADGQLGTVKRVGTTASYDILSQNPQWQQIMGRASVRMLEDCAVAAVPETRDGKTVNDIYTISYEDGTLTKLATLSGETMEPIGLDGDTLYVAERQDENLTAVYSIDRTNGGVAKVLSQSQLEFSGLYVGELQVAAGKLYLVTQDLLGASEEPLKLWCVDLGSGAGGASTLESTAIPAPTE